MEKEIKEFISARCEKALEENEDYMRDELSGNVDPDELQQRAEILCYIKGMRDFAQLLGLNLDLETLINGSRGSQKR